MYRNAETWRSRGYIPHDINPERIQFVTIRLYDAVPKHVISHWQKELNWHEGLPARDPRQRKLRIKIDKYLDKGYGTCWLARPDIAEMIEETLLHDDGIKYNLMAWCIMPNHLHAVVEFIGPYCLEQVLQTWKSVTFHKANRLLHRKGSFWFREYFDRYIRNSSHLNDAIEYVENNPVKAGLVSSKRLWRWSSAFYRRQIAGEGAGAPGPLRG